MSLMSEIERIKAARNGIKTKLRDMVGYEECRIDFSSTEFSDNLKERKIADDTIEIYMSGDGESAYLHVPLLDGDGNAVSASQKVIVKNITLEGYTISDLAGAVKIDGKTLTALGFTKNGDSIYLQGSSFDFEMTTYDGATVRFSLAYEELPINNIADCNTAINTIPVRTSADATYDGVYARWPAGYYDEDGEVDYS